MKKVIILKREPRNSKYKYKAFFVQEHRTVRFGAQGYSDYTIHKDPERMRRYVQRHQRKENWTYSGRFKPGFWSRWLLWSVPQLKNAIRLTEMKMKNQYKIITR